MTTQHDSDVGTALFRPVTVVLHLWGVDPARVPAALARMASSRGPLRRTPELAFAKLLGTGDGRTFTARDADPLHWALLTVWDDETAAARFATGRHQTPRSWARIAREELVVRMSPLSSRGRWSGAQPFGDPLARRVAGPVASITRARIAVRRARAFYRAVPAVSRDLHRVAGLQLAVGIGEAPLGLQGTFSLWDDAAALTEFAHRRAPHQDVVRRTNEQRWYAEELFARLEVLDVTGTFRGRRPFPAAPEPVDR